MTNSVSAGAAKLLATLNGTTPHPSSLPYDEEAPVVDAVAALEYASPVDFQQLDLENHQHMRARIRYLAALWPEADLQNLALRIHAVMNNPNFPVEDLRIILQGRKLSDPSRFTNEVPVKVIQGIGKCLKEGISLRSTAREMRVSYDTVEAIEKYIGLRSAVRLKQVDAAVEAARDGVSIRVFAGQLGVSRSKAHRLLEQGRNILQELGEINE